MQNDPTLHKLFTQDDKGRIAATVERRANVRQRLELTEIFAEVRGELGRMFRDETYYGAPIGYRRTGG